MPEAEIVAAAPWSGRTATWPFVLPLPSTDAQPLDSQGKTRSAPGFNLTAARELAGENRLAAAPVHNCQNLRERGGARDFRAPGAAVGAVSGSSIEQGARNRRATRPPLGAVRATRRERTSALPRCLSRGSLSPPSRPFSNARRSVAWTIASRHAERCLRPPAAILPLERSNPKQFVEVLLPLPDARGPLNPSSTQRNDLLFPAETHSMSLDA